MKRLLLLLELSINGLFTNKVRSLLTTLGIIIGIASVITMLSVGQGAQDDILSEIGTLGTNIITIIPGTDINKIGGNINNEEFPTLTEKDYDFLSAENRIFNVSAISPVFSREYTLKNQENEYSSSMQGVSAEYAEIGNIELQAGRFINEKDVNGLRKVIVIGSTLVDKLFPIKSEKGNEFENVLGEIISIGGSKFRIIGILTEQDSSGFTDPNTASYVPYSTASEILLVTDNMSTLKIKTVSSDTLDSTVYQIKKKLADFRKVDEPDFTIYTSEDLLNTVTEVTGTFTTLLASIAAISLLVGGIGISNIMLVSVTERTREIGLRKAIGARNTDIMTQFLLEAIFLTLIGGILGILLGIAGGKLIEHFAGLTASVSFFHILLATLVSTAIGIIFGFFPARKASKLDPIDALRYE